MRSIAHAASDDNVVVAAVNHVRARNTMNRPAHLRLVPHSRDHAGVLVERVAYHLPGLSGPMRRLLGAYARAYVEGRLLSAPDLSSDTGVCVALVHRLRAQALKDTYGLGHGLLVALSPAKGGRGHKANYQLCPELLDVLGIEKPSTEPSTKPSTEVTRNPLRLSLDPEKAIPDVRDEQGGWLAASRPHDAAATRNRPDQPVTAAPRWKGVPLSELDDGKLA